MPKARAILVLAIMLFSTVGVASAAEPVRVEKKPVELVRKTFDPAHPPAEMPHLAPNEAAITVSSFGIRAWVQVEVLSDQARGRQTESTVKITSVSLTTDLEITIWLPAKAAGYLTDHEEGHRLISERFYEGADKIARDLGKPLIGQVLSGEGATPAAARKAAIDGAIKSLTTDYLAATRTPSGRVNDIYDQITSHGRNRNVTVEQAIARALEQERQEEAEKKR